jgi:hypothetical protein
MYHVIRNQHLDHLHRTSGRIILLCRQGEASDRIATLFTQALGRPVMVQTLGTALPPEAADWVVPVQVVRSRFSRGDDAWSRLSRRLGAQRHGLADRLNHWLGARVELSCGAPVPAGDTAGLAAAAAWLDSDHQTPVVPTIQTLWPGVQDAVRETVGTVDDRAFAQLAKMANRYRLAAASALRGTVHYLSRRFFRGIWISGMGSTVFDIGFQAAATLQASQFDANLRIDGGIVTTVLTKSLEASNASMTQSVPELSLAQKLFSALTKVLQTRQTNIDGVLNVVR